MQEVVGRAANEGEPFVWRVRCWMTGPTAPRARRSTRFASSQHEQDRPEVETSAHSGFWQMAMDPKIYGLILVDILLLGANYTMVFSIPSMIKNWGISDLLHVGLLSTLPQIAGVRCDRCPGAVCDDFCARQRRLGYTWSYDRRRRLRLRRSAVCHDLHRISVEGEHCRGSCVHRRPCQSRSGRGPASDHVYYIRHGQSGLRPLSGRGPVSAVRSRPAGHVARSFVTRPVTIRFDKKQPA